ncbi:hypothetical protein AYL99_02658 [Fonsecaea erecta]|uniref:Uncharacterized protein n=1 Tax=Fonsecaea erecta TaxID=1367422 RepID=A0A178ZVE5_9EURO|nr:hypothetical protein AYL99_02658 [Fonsecaea erecta]OAP63431.1 hypothetical protein AYL99_02658 [Fonsecaea erecta]
MDKWADAKPPEARLEIQIVQVMRDYADPADVLYVDWTQFKSYARSRMPTL